MRCLAIDDIDRGEGLVTVLGGQGEPTLPQGDYPLPLTPISDLKSYLAFLRSTEGAPQEGQVGLQIRNRGEGERVVSLCPPSQCPPMLTTVGNGVKVNYEMLCCC